MDEYTKAKLADPTSVAIIDSSTAPVEEEEAAEDEADTKDTKSTKADAKKD